jgi:MFS family permease
VAALGIPAMAFPALRPPGIDPLLIILLCVAVWYACQGPSYAAYISWLSDLAPERRWGRFFAARQMATLAIALLVPTAASFARERWLRGLPDAARDTSFAVIFIGGGLLAVASILPLLRLPDIPLRTRFVRRPWWSLLRSAFADRSYRYLLVQSWWLSCAQGLSQAALFKYQVDILKIPISIHYVLTSVMLGLQLPLAAVAGRISDRYGDRGPLLLSLLAVSPALGLWLVATPETWWLFGRVTAPLWLLGVRSPAPQRPLDAPAMRRGVPGGAGSTD